MNLLSDAEIDACLSNPSMHIQARIIYRDFARAIEAAILAKLASAELPEPIKTYPKSKNVEKPFSVYSADQLRQVHAQGFAAGAAAQLAEKPSGYLRKWAFDGETPVKERKENGRMAWPDRFKLLPVTEIKLMQDDLPLYTRKEA